MGRKEVLMSLHISVSWIHRSLSTFLAQHPSHFFMGHSLPPGESTGDLADPHKLLLTGITTAPPLTWIV